MVARLLIFKWSGSMTIPFSRRAFDLMGEVGEVDDHAVSHDAGDFRTQDTGREQVQDEISPVR